MDSIPTNNERPAVGSSLTVKPFVPHKCGPWCNRINFISTFDRTKVSLIEQQLHCGWKRKMFRTLCRGTGRPLSNIVAYTAPCMRRLGNLNEVHRYLRMTKMNHLNVENFDCDPTINAKTTREFEAKKTINELRDLSGGKENMPVSCVNAYDDTMPPPLEYSAPRIPIEGVNLNQDDDFLCGCDCEDDCSDKSRCQCQQLTFKAARRVGQIENIGYLYKRLGKRLPHGIYECNARCKCKSNECMNRVVQLPPQMRLQVFMTNNRDWGVRALNDIPKGSFVCIFTGNLLTSGPGRRGRKAANARAGQEGSRQRVNTLMSAGDTPGPSEPRHRLSDPLVVDGCATGNVSLYVKHSWEPNLFCQNVFVDTHDLRFPWKALFAKQNIEAGSELTWD